jgi:Asp/Glu/hydantoin racemase
MKLVALIHTVPTVYATFGKRVMESIPSVRVTNMVDEFLASDPSEKGAFTTTNLRRLHRIVRAAEETGADAIVITCSTLSPHVETVRPFVCVPLVTIDGNMLRTAVRMGESIGVLATAESTLGPTTSGLRREAAWTNKEITISEVLSPKAYEAIKVRDQETHDREVLARASDLLDVDIIILAQASMAHLEDSVKNITGVPVLSSPRLCIAEIAAELNFSVASSQQRNPENVTI